MPDSRLGCVTAINDAPFCGAPVRGALRTDRPPHRLINCRAARIAGGAIVDPHGRADTSDAEDEHIATMGGLPLFGRRSVFYGPDYVDTACHFKSTLPPTKAGARHVHPRAPGARWPKSMAGFFEWGPC